MAYRIGELAEKCNVNKQTVRYYERIGLIPPPARNHSGYRSYPKDMVERLNFIKRMQELGFTLSEVDRFLGVVDKDKVRCRNMYEFTVEKISEIEQKINDLIRIKSLLNDLKEKCPVEKDLYECPIIETLMHNDQQDGIF